MPVLKNRAYVSTATTGTGTITLGSPVSGYQSFADAGVTNGNSVRYTLEDGANFEIGTGTYTASGTTLSRTPSESSNSGSAINLSGSARVFITAAAEDILQPSNNLSDLANASTSRTNLGVAIGSDVQAYSSVLQNTTASFTTADETKLDYITVTQAVSLDQMEIDIAALENGMVYKGDWNAGSGSFPGGGSAQTGWFYYVSGAGTVNGITFAIGDNIVATTDNASTSTYSGNWSKHDQTDAVQAVVGLTGSIAKGSLLTALNVEDGADVTDAGNVNPLVDSHLNTSTAASGEFLSWNGSDYDWAAVASGAFAYTRATKTANYTVVAGDLGNIIDVTSNSVTITMTSAATLGAGFYVYIRNSSTTNGHVVTVVGTSSQTINGSPNGRKLYRNEFIQLVCDGSNFYSLRSETPGLSTNLELPNSLGNEPDASGLNSICLGFESSATGVRSFTAGYQADATGDVSTALGYSATASGENSISIGDSIASGAGATAIGPDADALNTNTIAIGRSSLASNSEGIAIGRSATASSTSDIALGKSRANGSYSTAINVDHSGTTYGASGQYGISFAYHSKSSGSNSIAIGNTALSGTGATAVGYSSTASGTNSAAFGYAASTTHSNSTAIGNNASTNAANQVAIGNSSHAVRISEAYTLPTADGAAGTALVTNGSGVLSFSSVGADLYAANPSSATDPTASGNNALAIGDNATASNTDAIAIGSDATASNTETVAIGHNAIATNNLSYAIGHDTKTTGIAGVSLQVLNTNSSYGASGIYAMALGYNSSASNYGSIAIGSGAASQSQYAVAIGDGAAVYTSGATYAYALGRGVDVRGENAFGLGKFTKIPTTKGKYAYSAGGGYSAQTGTFVLRSDTTNATAEALTTNNSTAAADNQITLPDNSAYAFHGTIVAREKASEGTECAAWKVEGLIRREGSAGTTVLVNSATTIIDNTYSWGMALSADTTNGCLKIEVTGAASTNIYWAATINTSEVTYA
jgi:hypothetical protein